MKLSFEKALLANTISLIVVLLLYSPPAKSTELCTEDPFPFLSKFIKAIKEKDSDHKAATEAQIKSAPCTRQTPFTEKEMLEWISSNQSPERFSKKIHGISFESESPENLKAFEFLTSFDHPVEETKIKFQKTFESGCKKVACAVKEIFGDIGIQLLFMQQRFGMNGSHIRKRPGVAATWTKGELDHVLLALSDFPEGVLPLHDTYTLTHANRDIDSKDLTVNAVINVYNPWNELPDAEKRYAIVHEIGHVLGNVSNIYETDEWKSLSDWESKSKKILDREILISTTAKPETLVSEYAQVNENEDFAESLAAYRYNPEKLKTVNPAKYELIKRIAFNNIEYLSKETCSKPSRLTDKILTDNKEVIKDWEPDAEEYESLAKECALLAVQKLANEKLDLKNPEFKSCFKDSLKKLERSYMQVLLKDQLHSEFLFPMIRNLSLPISVEKREEIYKKASKTLSLRLSSQLKESVNDDRRCTFESNLSTIHIKFNEDQIGFFPYDAKDELVKIARKACEGKTSDKRNKIIDNMFQ